MKGGALRCPWVLLNVCGFVLLLLTFVLISINIRDADEFDGRHGAQSLTFPVIEVSRNIHPSGLEKPVPPQPLDQSTVAEWRSVVEKRNQLLGSVCNDSSLRNLTHAPIRKFVLDRIFVSDKHKILYCQTPKVGNTQWKKILIVLRGAYSHVKDVPESIVHSQWRSGLKRLSSFSSQEIEHRLKTYFKFFFVRDPFERLVSAFKDKFKDNPRDEPWYKNEIAPAIIRKYRKGHYPGSALHFEDFVRYLGDVQGRRLMDRRFGEPIIHWATFSELCAPCEINYDVVGHQETLEKDAPQVLRAAGVDHLVSYPAIPRGITTYNKPKVQSYFSGISKEDIRRLYARYQGDFELFGYPRPDFLLDGNHD
ncbi:carbohydrate sulfotransferase 10-like [Aulostomus maculatus]